MGIQELEGQLVSTELDELRKRMFALESQESKLRSLKNLAEQRISLISQQELSSREAEVTELSTQLNASEAELALVETEIDSIASRLREKEELRQQVSNALSNFEAELLRQRSSVEEAERERNKVAGTVSVQESKIEGFAEQILRLGQAAKEAALRVTELESQQGELAPEIASTSDDALRLAYEKAQGLELELRSKVEVARDELHVAERERDAVAAKHSALGMTLEQADGSLEVRKAKLAGIKGLLAESVSIEKGYETAIAVALGALSDAIVAESREQAVEALKYLRSEGLGRAEFVIASGAAVSGSKDSVGDVVSASSVVKAPKSVLAVLDPFLIAPDLQSAQQALGNSKLAGKSIITLDGDLVSESLV
jgi:chromosome segregation protein